MFPNPPPQPIQQPNRIANAARRNRIALDSRSTLFDSSNESNPDRWRKAIERPFADEQHGHISNKWELEPSHFEIAGNERNPLRSHISSEFIHNATGKGDYRMNQIHSV
jgi:hypothetical protein